MPKPLPTDAEREAARARLQSRLSRMRPGARVRRMLRVGGGSRPDVAVVELAGVACVVKDHQGCDPLFARLVGPLLARREVAALQRLVAVDGVPRVLDVLDRRAFAMTLLDAEPYRRRQRDVEQWRMFFQAMQALLADMHAAGVAHADLRSPDNTLMTAAGQPALVDFVASYRRGSRFNPLGRWMFARLCAVDASAIEKHKRTVCPSLVVDGAAVRGEAGFVGRLARGFGVQVRRLARRLFTRADR